MVVKGSYLIVVGCVDVARHSEVADLNDQSLIVRLVYEAVPGR